LVDLKSPLGPGSARIGRSHPGPSTWPDAAGSWSSSKSPNQKAGGGIVNANLYASTFPADTDNPTIVGFRGYFPGLTSSQPGDGQRRIQLQAKLEF